MFSRCGLWRPSASSMRSFRIHELAKYIDWWQNLVIHEGPIFEHGYLTIP